MIERKFVSQNIKEFQIKEYLFSQLSRVGMSNVKLQRTPLGEKIVVTASRPGLIVGKGGNNISRLTRELKEKFGLENPQIEIEEVIDPRVNAAIVAEMIANSLERFGSARFKGIAHQAMAGAIEAGALGIEILISGKVPSARAKTWRFYLGYLKKCGDIAFTGVDKSIQHAKLKAGVIGVQVRIMPSTTVLPDRMRLRDDAEIIVEEVKGQERQKIADELEQKGIEEDKKKKAAAKEKKARAPKKKKEEKSESPAEPAEEKVEA